MTIVKTTQVWIYSSFCLIRLENTNAGRNRTFHGINDLLYTSQLLDGSRTRLFCGRKALCGGTNARPLQILR